MDKKNRDLRHKKGDNQVAIRLPLLLGTYRGGQKYLDKT